MIPIPIPLPIPILITDTDTDTDTDINTNTDTDTDTDTNTNIDTDTDTDTDKKTCVKLYINMKMGARDLYIDEVHMALDISHFAVFLFYLNEHFQPKFCLVAVSDIGNFLLCPRY